MKPEPTLVLYHADCPDGFGAAWAYWRQRGDQARYLPLYYDQATLPEVAGEDVVMVDVSDRAERLWALHAQARSFRLVDHHASAAAHLGHLPFAHYDLSHSGAVLGWQDAFGPDVPVPLLLRLIEDRDLWQWKLEGARECLFVLDTLPRTFAAWSAFAERLEQEFEAVRAEGRIMTRQYDAMIQRFLGQAHPFTLAGMPGKIVNVPNFFANEVAGQLSDQVPLGVTWQVGPDGLAHVSFRANKAVFNLIPITEALGGGGGPGSGGARLSLARMAALYQGQDLLADRPDVVQDMVPWLARWTAHHAPRNVG